MKRLMPLFIAAVLFGTFTTVSHATERNFPAGSYIIPMDSVYQPEADGGIFEAYGLVYQLLDNGVTVYWIIDETKTSCSAVDLAINDATTSPVVDQLVHATAGITAISGITSTISYVGAPFVISANDSVGMTIINSVISNTSWDAVDVHKSNVAFAANVSREMTGTPPKIALMNSVEDKTAGNAAILEGYLRLAGVSSSTYAIVSPYDIMNGVLDAGATTTDFPDVPTPGEYTMLWSPHWAGFEKSPYTSTHTGTLACETDDPYDADAIVKKVADFLDAGNALFAECASIQAFEHSNCGRFLSTNDFAHDGGTMDSTLMVYNECGAPFSQVGDFTYAPEGGHLHNWRPWFTGELYDTTTPSMVAPDARITPNSTASAYQQTVSRYVHDDANQLNIPTNSDVDQWDYYVGGRKDGDSNKGYVVYLGGHKYAKCSGQGSTGSTSGSGGGNTTGGGEGTITLEFEWKDDVSNQNAITITVNYTDPDTSAPATLSVGPFAWGSTSAAVGTKLEFDFSNATFDSNGKKIKDVVLKNIYTADITITGFDITWDTNSKRFKKIKDKTNGADIFNNTQNGPLTEADITGRSEWSNYVSDSYSTLTTAAVTANASSNVTTTTTTTTTTTGVDTTTNFTDNADCTWTNVAGVRYVLNTLFNLQFTVVDVEYIKSTPVTTTISGTDILFQGSYKYPSYSGNFKAYKTTDTVNEVWNLSTNMPATAAKVVFTNVGGTKTDFDSTSINSLRTPLNVTPSNGDDTDELALISKVRGLGLGGIEHSSPAVVAPSSRVSSTRPYTAFIGDVFGNMHAVDVSSVASGSASHLWTFIPESQLGSLKNDRTDATSASPYPGVDGEMSIADIYMRNTNTDFTTRTWKTLLVSMNGAYGEYSSLYALDVSDPTTPALQWEKRGTSDNAVPDSTFSNVVMGNGSRVIVVKVLNTDGTYQYLALVATSYKDIVNNYGGIRVFAFDLLTGDQMWNWNADYVDSVNDIPGSITGIDTDSDGYEDTVVVGDYDGRLWEINALTGANVNGNDASGAAIPLFNGGTGADIVEAGVGYPISASPSVGYDVDGNIILYFGNGGADWAADTNYYSVIALNMTVKRDVPDTLNGAGSLEWNVTLDQGEKVWSEVTVTDDAIYFTTVFGTAESTDPSSDTASLSSSGSSGNLRIISTTGATKGTVTSTTALAGKTRSSVYIYEGQLYSAQIDGTITAVDLGLGSSTEAPVRSWKENF